MSTLIAVGYDNPFKAEEVGMKLQKMSHEEVDRLQNVLAGAQV
jgi:uncharacterized membrane protein